MKSSTETRLIKTPEEFCKWRCDQETAVDGDGRPFLGFVPTMGALHEGHLSLIRQAVKECRKVVVSIFVNPLQFGPNEDFEKYPRNLQADLSLCEKAGVHAVVNFNTQELYPHHPERSTKVFPPEELEDRLCGAVRPGHFVGVATVVLKLLMIVQPQQAYFGQKDFQQLAIIQRMVSDFFVPVRVVPVPTVREADGLAMSSRNVYLKAQERITALELYRTLCSVREDVLNGKSNLQDSLKAGRDRLAGTPGVTLQYLEACDPESLAFINDFKGPVVVLVAARVGEVRLIDNLLIT